MDVTQFTEPEEWGAIKNKPASVNNSKYSRFILQCTGTIIVFTFFILICSIYFVLVIVLEKQFYVKNLKKLQLTVSLRPIAKYINFSVSQMTVYLSNQLIKVIMDSVFWTDYYFKRFDQKTYLISTVGKRYRFI